MAAVDAFSIREVESSTSQAQRWGAGLAVAVALHGAAYLYLNRTPEPVGFASQAPIELDLLPPPSGAAQTDAAGADANVEQTPEEAVEPTELEELSEIPPDETQPPPETETTTVEPPPDEVQTVEETPPLTETPPVAAMEIPPDVTAAPPDVEPAVTLPPSETVTAQEEEIDPPKPAPKPVARKVEPKPEKKPERKPEPKREVAQTPRRDAQPAERPRPAQNAAQAGGRGGASANAGAARAASAAYGGRVRAAVAAQKRSSSNLSGRAVVSFTVTRSGAVTGVSASGPGPAAAEAAAMVRRASIPAMPAEMTGGSARYSIPINFTPGR